MKTEEESKKSINFIVNTNSSKWRNIPIIWDVSRLIKLISRKKNWEKRSFKRHPLWATTQKKLHKDTKENLLSHKESTSTRELCYYWKQDTGTGAQFRVTVLTPLHWWPGPPFCFHQCSMQANNSHQLSCNKTTIGTQSQWQQWGMPETHEKCWQWKGRAREEWTLWKQNREKLLN